MNQLTTQDTTPYFFLVWEKYTIGTPRGISASERVIDISFNDLIDDYNLQNKLGLLGAALLKPAFPLINEAFGVGVGNGGVREKEKRIDMNACYLSSFNKENYDGSMQYLKDNGLIRILITDDKLKQELQLSHGKLFAHLQ